MTPMIDLRRTSSRLHLGLLLTLLAGTSACTSKRSLRIESVPPGALVRLDEQVLGRTPLETEFQHYGRRRITLYLPGYLPYSETVNLDRPWYATFPVDIFTEIVIPMGLHDRRRFNATLLPDNTGEEQEQFGALLRRAQSLRARHTQPQPGVEPGAEQTEEP